MVEIPEFYWHQWCRCFWLLFCTLKTKSLYTCVVQLIIHCGLGTCKLGHVSHCCCSWGHRLRCLHLWLTNVYCLVVEKVRCCLANGLSVCVYVEPFLQVEIRNTPRKESLSTQSSIERHRAPSDRDPCQQGSHLNRGILWKILWKYSSTEYCKCPIHKPSWALALFWTAVEKKRDFCFFLQKA